MNTLKIVRPCVKCGSSGKETIIVDGVPTEIDCTGCEGEGQVVSLNTIDITEFKSDVMNKLNDIKEKVDEIMDKLNEA